MQQDLYLLEIQCKRVSPIEPLMQLKCASFYNNSRQLSTNHYLDIITAILIILLTIIAIASTLCFIFYRIKVFIRYIKIKGFKNGKSNIKF